MGHANYFRSLIEKESDIMSLNSVMDELNSKINNISAKMEKSKDFQRVNLATELKALKLVFSIGNDKVKELNKEKIS
ncbi:hypothetical protein J4414_03290 [Candidatus Woesearchaeota archaeon]|nr:hypothetical protein [Candidatus Woesearchaeota archaeon]